MVYQKEISEVLCQCETSLQGLSEEQVLKHREKYGENVLAEKQRKSKDSLVQLLTVYGFAFIPTVIIQIKKILCN